MLVCDRCKEKNSLTSLVEPIDTQLYGASPHQFRADLCSECRNAFQKWLSVEVKALVDRGTQFLSGAE